MIYKHAVADENLDSLPRGVANVTDDGYVFDCAVGSNTEGWDADSQAFAQAELH